MVADHPAPPGRIAPLLVGRERERTAMRQQLDAALTGHGGLVLVGGEAGIGKTALAEAICREAAEQGALVLVGRCYDLTETPPYGPWIELFGQYRQTDAAPPLPPAFAQRGTVGDVTSQAALFQQVMDFLTTLTAQRPIVLLLDDLHWADPASLDLLRVVARNLATDATLLLVTYRADELTRRHPLYTLLPLLEREAGATRLDLRRLIPDAVRALVAARYHLPDTDETRLATYLHERTEGNSLFVMQLLRALREDGVLHPLDGQWALDDLTRVGVPIPLRQVIDARVLRLGEEGQRLLGIASVIGQEVPVSLWAAVAAADEETLLDLIDRAGEKQILDETPDGAGVRFAHALIREALYEGIPALRRRRMHTQVGEWLAEQPNADPDAVAYHFQQAGDARAADWLVQAGERAQRAFASVTAAERYKDALTLMGQAGIHASERGWLLFRLARLYVLRDSHHGIAYLEEAARLAEETGDRLLAAYSLFTLGDIRYLGGDIDRGLAEMRAGVVAHSNLSIDERSQRRSPDIYGALDGDYARIELLNYLGTGGRYADAKALAADILAEVPGPPSPEWAAFGHGYGGLALMHAAMGQADEARHAFVLERAARHARAGDYNVGLSALNELRFVALPYQTEDHARQEHLAAEAEQEYARARAIGLPPERGRLPLMALEGHWTRVKAAARAVLMVGGNGAYMGNARCALAPLARAQGDASLAWQLVREGLPKGPTTSPGDVPLYLDSLILQRLATALAIDAGDLPLADAWLAAHDEWLTWSGAVLGRAEGDLLWARYHRAMGDTAAVYESATRALQLASEPRQPLALLAAHRLLGELDTDTGRFDDATVHLDTALALAEACGAPYERALTLLALAGLRAAMGDSTATATLLDEVRTICIPLGAKPALARADDLTARLVAAEVVKPAYPAGLSIREVEVLRLVAKGQTNREIADTLFLSEHTVRVHVRNILTKTATDNRAGATAFAYEHDLA